MSIATRDITKKIHKYELLTFIVFAKTNDDSEDDGGIMVMMIISLLLLSS